MPNTDHARLHISISPSGRLTLRTITDADETESAMSVDDGVARRLERAFGKSPEAGLLELATVDRKQALSLDLLFWRSWTRRLLTAITQLDDQQFQAFEAACAGSKSATLADPAKLGIRPPDDLALAVLIADAPPMTGLEFLTPDVLKSLWSAFVGEFAIRAKQTDGGCRSLLQQLNPDAHLLGRVTFHLAENKKHPERPFAFLATYANRLSARAQVQHLPLAEALRQYAAERDQAKLAELLTPVRDAATNSSLVGDLLTTRALFAPQAWSIPQAYRFLNDVPKMEAAGLMVRVPDWWKSRRTARPQVQVRIGDQRTSAVGLDALLDFSAELTIDGHPLTDEERQQLLAATDGLTLLRGQWIEVDQRKLKEALDHWELVASDYPDGITFLDGMRMLAGAPTDAISADDNAEVDAWTSVVAGDWLAETLQQIRSPSGIVGCEPGRELRATLRPYQADGVRWLWFMMQLGFGACLADDMGLGKTIQIIDLILRLKAAAPVKSRGGRRTNDDAAAPFLLVVPASLVGNWKNELARFAPQLRTVFAHRSECDAETLDRIAAAPVKELAGVDVVVTTYSLARRAEWLASMRWKVVVLDEAQAIKNAGSAQSKSVRKLKSSGRIVLTGTPVENQLGDLWSLFDFCMPGLLGNVKQFRAFVKNMMKNQDTSGVASLRRLVRPYILRRMKTDPNIVPDLPDKTEVVVDCGLTKKQAVLYEQYVKDITRQIERSDGIQRRGLVLSMLLRLKQLCNHPSQFLDQSAFPPDDSGKFSALRNICEQVRDRQEKVLVFSQFQSLCEPLANWLSEVFGREGLILHGGVAVAKRSALVKRFQEDDDVPFFVISVKAGGTGLNLTAASHVVHFDRWWNPAVENQATDRAFRIGQKRNVLVHKFVCRGTLEERIDQMIRDKQQLADDVLSDGAESLLTEMSDSELMKFVALDVTKALEE